MLSYRRDYITIEQYRNGGEHMKDLRREYDPRGGLTTFDFDASDPLLSSREHEEFERMWEIARCMCNGYWCECLAVDRGSSETCGGPGRVQAIP